MKFLRLILVFLCVCSWVSAHELTDSVSVWLDAPVRSLSVLSGGLTNQSYMACTQRGEQLEKFVVRLGKPAPENLGINRAREVACQAAAACAGIAPCVLYSDVSCGTLISSFIVGKTCGVDDIRDTHNWSKIVQMLKTCHHIPYEKTFDTGSVYDNIRAMLARSLACPQPFITVQAAHEVHGVIDNIERYFSDKDNMYAGLCHCDLLPANIMDDGEQLWLIDWEYACWGNILFDLASLCIEAGFGENQTKDFLFTYFGTSAQEHYQAYHLVCVLFNLRNAFWYDLRGQEIPVIAGVSMAEMARKHMALFKQDAQALSF